jgi:hypothetical protein
MRVLSRAVKDLVDPDHLSCGLKEHGKRLTKQVGLLLPSYFQALLQPFEEPWDWLHFYAVLECIAILEHSLHLTLNSIVCAKVILMLPEVVLNVG